MRLIDADKINFEEVIGGKSDFAEEIRNSMKELIDKQPTVLGEKHARWIDYEGDYSYAVCSNCKEEYEVSDKEPSKENFELFCGIYRYCHVCGCRMDLKEE